MTIRLNLSIGSTACPCPLSPFARVTQERSPSSHGDAGGSAMSMKPARSNRSTSPADSGTMPDLPGTLARCYRPEMTTLRGRPGDRASVHASEPGYRLDIMTQDDVPEVSRVERGCFTNPWPASAYRRELQNPAQNYYVVLRAMQAGTPASPERDNGQSQGHAAQSELLPRGPLPRRSLL